MFQNDFVNKKFIFTNIGFVIGFATYKTEYKHDFYNNSVQ
jgi:hypothetical protein